jgi:hypothetical protein
LGEAVFTDDGNPPGEDAIANFGHVRWGASGANSCPVPIAEACCFPNGSCEVLMESECSTSGGTWQGPNTVPLVCDPNPCTVVCCLANGLCIQAPPENCLEQGGSVDSLSVSCDPNPCNQPPLRACCFAGGFCRVLGQDDCEAFGGNWLENEAVCEPNPCVSSDPGACCSPTTGRCYYVSQSVCGVMGLLWLGIGADCDPNPCPRPFHKDGEAAEDDPVRLETVPTTWGRIKAGYR